MAVFDDCNIETITALGRKLNKHKKVKLVIWELLLMPCPYFFITPHSPKPRFLSLGAVDILSNLSLYYGAVLFYVGCFTEFLALSTSQ